MTQLIRRIGVVLEAIKFPHSLFALPFALMSMLLAAGGWPTPRTILWIVLACVFARSAAMGFNRWADADLDARNPRTRGRALPGGLLSRRFMLVFVVANGALFFVAAAMLNSLCLWLAAPCLAFLLGYSYTKRWTAASHLWLGAALGLAPAGAWIAIRGEVALVPVVISAAVMFWVGGFDILYACQDLDVDRREGLHSIPARLGVRGALWASAAFHAAAWAGFAAAGWLAGLGAWYGAGLAAAAALLAWQHWIVRPSDLSRINAAFFNANGLLSIVMFLTVVAEITARQ